MQYARSIGGSGTKDNRGSDLEEVKKQYENVLRQDSKSSKIPGAPSIVLISGNQKHVLQLLLILPGGTSFSMPDHTTNFISVTAKTKYWQNDLVDGKYG